MGAKLFVGNLNFETTKEDLEGLFGEIGQVVDCFMPVDRMSGRPRGFAFVEMSNNEEAAAAIEKFDEYELNGRNLRINEAQERQPRSFPPGGGGGDWNSGGGGGGQYGKKSKGGGSRKNLRNKKRGF